MELRHGKNEIVTLTCLFILLLNRLRASFKSLRVAIDPARQGVWKFAFSLFYSRFGHSVRLFGVSFFFFPVFFFFSPFSFRLTLPDTCSRIRQLSQGRQFLFSVIILQGAFWFLFVVRCVISPTREKENCERWTDGSERIIVYCVMVKSYVVTLARTLCTV